VMGKAGRAGASWFLHQAVVDQAGAHSSRPAVVSGSSVLTYGEFAENAFSIARQLLSAGVGREAPVVSCLPRGLALAPAVLGTWLAGAACVPVDPYGPPDRRAYMLRDSKATAIIATAETAAAVAGSAAPVVVVDSAGAAADRPGRHAATGLPAISASNLAYVIYTSGSTGRPKGVLVEHGNLAAMALSHEAVLFGGQGRDISHVALNNVTIADSFFSDLAHLGYGRTLHVVDDLSRRDPDRLARFLGGHGIEMIDATPTQVQALVLAGRGDCLASLKVLVLGGEPTSPDLWQRLSGLPGVEPYNLYGPTECTVAVTAAAFRDFLSPMLGTPLPGCSVWVVDDALRPAPDGETGELLITGAQVARGYLNPGAADAARFVRFRLPDGSGTVRAYRTGDRGRRDRAGRLEFLGRTDSQVSISGHRVEIGEVETTLRECEGVRAAAVEARRDGPETVVAAYAVLDDGMAVEDIRVQLAAMLPAHMIPGITVVPGIPMGPTGKADFAGLAKVSRELRETTSEIVAPELVAGSDDPDVVAVVRRIWRASLRVATVESADDFFALGGDSLKATQVIVAIRESLVPEIPIRVLFDHPRFQEFCAAVGAYLQGGAAGGADRRE
jgi:amino acid adenylation domain-containing protein